MDGDRLPRHVWTNRSLTGDKLIHAAACQGKPSSDVKRYPINDISVAQIDIRMSNGHSAYGKQNSMSVNTLRLSLFPLK